MRSYIIFLSILVVTLALSMQGVTADDGDCYDEHMKLTIKRGETVYPEGECIRMSCTDDGRLRPEPCEMAIPPGCRIVDGDMSKKWPGCCPTYVCI